MKTFEDNHIADGIGPYLVYGPDKHIGNCVYQIPVTGNGVTVMVRVRALCSSFTFLWSSRKISKEAQDRICEAMTYRFWG